MPATGKAFRGAARTTPLTTNMTATAPAAGDTIGGEDLTGWPDGTGGKSFVLVVDAGNLNEEKILCSSRAGNLITVEQRAYDGTAASSHTAGAANLSHVLDADTIQRHEDRIAALGEIILDTVGAALVAGAGVTIAVDDPGNTITVSSTGKSPTRQVFGADATWVKPAGATLIRVECRGGGGGGRSGVSQDAGGGGGGAYTVRELLAADVAASVAVNVGAGGTAGVDGGGSTFGPYLGAAGGRGGGQNGASGGGNDGGLGATSITNAQHATFGGGGGGFSNTRPGGWSVMGGGGGGSAGSAGTAAFGQSGQAGNGGGGSTTGAAASGAIPSGGGGGAFNGTGGSGARGEVVVTVLY